MLYDGEVMRILQRDGRGHHTFALPTKYLHLVFIDHLNSFVGWAPNDSTLHVSQTSSIDYLSVCHYVETVDRG